MFHRRKSGCAMLASLPVFFFKALCEPTRSLSISLPKGALAMGNQLKLTKNPSGQSAQCTHFDNTSAARCTHSMTLLSMGFQQMPSLPFPSPIKNRQSQRRNVTAELPTRDRRRFQYFTEGSTNWVDFLGGAWGISMDFHSTPQGDWKLKMRGGRLPKWSFSEENLKPDARISI